MEEFDLTGRTALVTGAGRGIRLEIARQLTRNGARLIAYEANRASADRGGCANLNNWDKWIFRATAA
jgi:NAD(P)-dependent dehydrogenase (short-subunit alcohol dehydrogenase family)